MGLETPGEVFEARTPSMPDSWQSGRWDNTGCKINKFCKNPIKLYNSKEARCAHYVWRLVEIDRLIDWLSEKTASDCRAH